MESNSASARTFTKKRRFAWGLKRAVFIFFALGVVLLLLASSARFALGPNGGWQEFKKKAIWKNVKEGVTNEDAEERYTFHWRHKTPRRQAKDDSDLPSFAYSITGAPGDTTRLLRLLAAIYHPRNAYVIHMDAATNQSEMGRLFRHVRSDPVISVMKNVHVVENRAVITYRGISMLAAYLHCSSILLKQFPDWDWYINLSAADYPLVTQDDLIYTFSQVPRHLNFIAHSSKIGWKLYERVYPVYFDKGLYTGRKVKPKISATSLVRPYPSAFKLFQGSAWVVLSRAFVEYVTFGVDNLPRLLLLYFANYVSSPEYYFQTVVCNSEFRSTVVNIDLHFVKWPERSSSSHPLDLRAEHIPEIVEKGSPFARKFKITDALDIIDKDLLGITNGSYPRGGGWCSRDSNGSLLFSCDRIGNASELNWGDGALRLGILMKRLLNETDMRDRQCQ